MFTKGNVLVLIALTEAAKRFKELQVEKEMKQLQEDRKNDKKPPPYRHIKVLHVAVCSAFPPDKAAFELRFLLLPLSLR